MVVMLHLVAEGGSGGAAAAFSTVSMFCFDSNSSADVYFIQMKRKQTELDQMCFPRALTQRDRVSVQDAKVLLQIEFGGGGVRGSHYRDMKP